MSLRDKLRELENDPSRELFDRFGILSNPFPMSNQTMGHPRLPSAVDEHAEDRVVTFFRDDTSKVVVIEGTQGVGKTNFLNHFETEVREALQDQEGYYVVRYLADPEGSFDGTTKRVFEELGKEHLEELVRRLGDNDEAIEEARSPDMQSALRALSTSFDEESKHLMNEWLLGQRPLKQHRQVLGVQFRLDTVESKTAALRDIAEVSGRAGVLKGVFLLLDEIEKHGGVLTQRAVMQYLTALRALVDAFPKRLFLMIAVTPNALSRYAEHYPALRSRLEDRLELKPLTSVKKAQKLAEFYMDQARHTARERQHEEVGGQNPILSAAEIRECFIGLEGLAPRRGLDGVLQREFLHRLHELAEEKLK